VNAYEKLDPKKRKILHARSRLTSVRYRSPVFLVGSALKAENPRDWDVRVVMTHRTFYQIFAAELNIEWGSLLPEEAAAHQWMQEGRTGEWTALRLRWGSECVKQGDSLCNYTGLNIDFQIQPSLENDFYYKDEPRTFLARAAPKEYQKVPLERV